MDYSLGNIQRHIAAKTASAGLASTVASSTPVEQPRHQHHSQAIAGANGYYNAANGDVSNGAAQTYSVPGQEMQQHDQNTYQTSQAYYAEPQATTMPPYASASLQAYNNGAYGEADMKPNIEAQLTASMQYTNPAQQTTPTGFAGHPHPSPHPSFQATPPQAGPSAWRNFTEGVMTNMPSGSDYAQTLMALQNPAHAAANDGGLYSAGNMNIPALGGLQLPAQMGGGQPWPLIHYGGTGANVPGQ